MTNNARQNQPAAAAGTFLLGGDLPVARLGLRAMRLPVATFAGPARDPQDGIAVVRRAVELGVNHIDTAGSTGVATSAPATSSAGRWPLTPRHSVIATKVGPIPGPDGVPSLQAAPGQLRGLVEDNLRELGLDRLDLVYLRVGGMNVPGGEPFAALAALRDEGLIRHLGLSNVDAAQLAEARAVAPVVAVHNTFHVHHTGDAALLAQCAQDSIAFVPFFPLGGGRDPIDAARLEKAVARHQATVPQVALAWLLAASPALLPIPGTGTLAHLEQIVAAAALKLTPEDLATLGGRRD